MSILFQLGTFINLSFVERTCPSLYFVRTSNDFVLSRGLTINIWLAHLKCSLCIASEGSEPCSLLALIFLEF